MAFLKSEESSRLYKNFSYIFLSQGASSIIYFLALIYLARIFGPQGFGKIGFVEGLMMSLLVIASFGTDIVLVKEIAIDNKRLKNTNYTGSAIFLRAAMGVLSFLLLVTITFFLKFEPELKTLIIIYGTSILFLLLNVEWAFQGIERMEYCGISYLIREGVFAILVFSFIRGKNQILFAGFFYSASRLAYSCYLLYKFFKVSGKIPLAADPAICKTLLKNAAPIGLIYIFSQVIWNFGLISLGIWETKESVGYYNAALKPILFYLMFINAYFIALFPFISSYSEKSMQSLQELLSKTAENGLTVSIPIIFSGTILAKRLIETVYGKEYEPATLPFQILLCACLIVFINTTYSRTLLVLNSKTCSAIIGIQSLICIIFSILLIKSFSAAGVCAAIIIEEIIGFALYYTALSRLAEVKIPFYKFLTKPLVASVFLVVFLKMFYKYNLIFLLIGGIAIYIFVLVVLNKVQVDRKNVETGP